MEQKAVEPRHVVMFSPEVGGIRTHVDDLARGLVAAGVRVSVVSPTEGSTRLELKEGVEVHHFHYDRPTSYPHLFDAIATRHAMEQFATGPKRPDLVHGHDWYTADTARELAQRHGVPWVTTAHSLTVHAAHDPIVLACEPAERAAYAPCKTIIAVCQFVKRTLIDTYGLDGTRIHEVNNGVDTSRLLSEPLDPAEAAEIKEQLGPLTGQLVVFAGRLTISKGVPALLRSIPLVAAHHPGVRYCLVGSPGLRSGPEVRMLMARPEIGGRARLLPPRSRQAVAEIYRSAALAVVPSLNESLPYAILEPMALGIPVVGSRVGGIEEVLDGTNGLTVPLIWNEGRPEVDVPSLAEAQVQMLSDPERAARFAARARETIASRHTLRQMVDQVRAVYQAAVA